MGIRGSGSSRDSAGEKPTIVFRSRASDHGELIEVVTIVTLLNKITLAVSVTARQESSTVVRQHDQIKNEPIRPHEPGSTNCHRWREGLPLTNEIIRLPPDQFEPARLTLGHAFENYPLMTYALPQAAGRLKAVSSLYGSILWDCLRWGEVYATRDLAGVACWLPPGQTSPSLPRLIRSGMLKLPWLFGWTGFRRLQAYEETAHKLHNEHAPGSHWYLWAIGVRPQDQGKGIAGQLVAPILARAHQDSLPCYLETHAETNVKIYKRLGFEVASSHTLAGHPLPVWGMVSRPA
jgi:GNAT superfamily N-acetyltransferase